ncbi:MAG TPA: transcription-repair coupling factor [Dehalococcoidia bacterium]|nr:transcription-repair coupling factor [Dehalococcoidia bacterium]
MELGTLLEVVASAPTLQRVVAMTTSRSLRLTLGVPDAAKAPTVAALFRASGRSLLLVVPRPERAEALAEEVAAWLGDGESVLLFPDREALPYERLGPDLEAVAGRLRVLARLRQGRPVLVVASARALAQRTLTPSELAEASPVLRQGDRLEPERFLRSLLDWGYTLEPAAERPGHVARRGGIIDVFPPGQDLPLRIELWGNRIESLRRFDPETQRSLGPVAEAELGPAREASFRRPWPPWTEALDLSSLPAEAQVRLGRELEELAQSGSGHADHFWVPFFACGTLLQHLPGDSLVVVDERSELQASLRELEAQSLAARSEMEQRGELPRGLPLPHLPSSEMLTALEAVPKLLWLSRWASGEEGEDTLRLPFAPAQGFGGQLRRLLVEATRESQRGTRVVIVSHQAPRLSEMLAEQGPTEGVKIVHGSLAGGWRLEEGDARLLLLSDREVFGTSKERRPQPRRYLTAQVFLSELSPGDYVVHADHGIGRFRGLVRSSLDGVEREYLELEYAEGDRLLVPVDQMDRVARYLGPSDHEPRLTRLGSGEWQRTKQRVRQAVADLARELVTIYAAREVFPGHPFPPDTPWQLELEASFPYLETPDQLAAIAEVKRDMESPRPMDRLICGDVGYGKTEIALRAAFKAAMDGKQVAVLVPTTVLAQQHYETFRRRLAPFPVRVGLLSRFLSEREQREVVKALANGSLDIVIGTHRLLQRDVRFKDLGLVIIDEEQRFGVAHKEHLKRLRREVDVLTLSATPIPRTLYMALGGVRDMSLLETPPESRLPIKTYVAEYDGRLVREAIRRELARGGQVFYVHNRVQSIGEAARRVQELVPEARIAIAHGQMDEEELALVMEEFVAGRIDVLVCTTIIESGLDIPNVNTIVIEDADRLGLAQLYQLRGRVGRGAHRAYAYLLYDPRSQLSEAAKRRLQAIFEATELGAGFQIALRDLEIRGAGNLLGPEQSGHMAAVGLDLYSRLLAEAARRLRAAMRGEVPPPPREGPEIIVDLPISGYLPESYVPDLNQRLALYQRLAEAPSPEAVDEVAGELRDRFGPLPPPAEGLLEVARLRSLARRAGVRSLAVEGGALVVRMAEGRRLPAAALPRPLPRGAEAGPTSLRLDPVALGDGWRKLLREVLEGIISADEACGEKMGK